MRNFFKVSLTRILLAGFLVLLLQGQVLAGAEQFTCRVNLAGLAEDYSLVTLTDMAETPAFVSRQFILPTDKSREMLAVALMAIGTGNRVVVAVDLEDEAGDYPEISSMFLQERKALPIFFPLIDIDNIIAQ